MSRILVGIAACALTSVSIGPTQAADWGASQPPAFKPAYPMEMAPMEDDLDFEAGFRYFYGMGGQSFNLDGTTYGSTDTSHSLEVHGRIDDRSTSTYVKGHIGYGAITDGQYEMDGAANGDYNTGRVGYIAADFGYAPLQTETLEAGVFGGYMYADESPQGSGLIVHGLRLGVSGRAAFNDLFDVSAEAAAIPYSNVTGSLYNPAESISGIEGSLYGGSAEIMAGFHVSDNLVIRGGARGTYLNGYVTSDEEGEQYIETYRWGPLVELTGTF